MSYHASPSEFIHATLFLVRLVKPVYLSVNRKSISSTLFLLKNVSGPYLKRTFINFCTSNFPSLIRPDDSIAYSTTDKASLFGSYFFANSFLSNSNAPNPPTKPIPSIIISARKVRRVLHSSKTDKSCPRFLKEFAGELMPVLCRLFYFIHIFCIFPSSWKHALVQPVPKKGDRFKPSNYHFIALTSATAKDFETLLNSTLSNISNLTIFSQITSMAFVR